MAVAIASRKDLIRRLHDLDDEFSVQPLPNVNAIGYGGIDLSVGTVFLAAERSSAASVVASRPHESERMFVEVRIRPGERFVMQPRQFVLASTFEYLIVPKDLAGFIQSRSTYGRMGIISATAAYVGPGYHGSPTLELVNVGEVAVELCPYDPICQIVLFSAEEEDLPPSRYQCSTRPDFARRSIVEQK